jgi:hypothetical protein
VRAIVAACALVGGCALLQPAPAPEAAPLGPAEVRSAQAARDTLSIGNSTRADVRAALGDAIVVDFDSGYEVWVYREQRREKMRPPATELVLLFEPSGVLTKTRIRQEKW